MTRRIVMSVGLAGWAAAMAWTSFAMTRRDSTPVPSGPQINTSISAADADEITLDAPNGRVEVAAGPDDAISVTVDGAAAGASIDSARSGRQIRLQLGGPGGHAEERWVVRVPARLRARIDLDRGEIHVRGISGGLTASLRSGAGSRPGVIRVDVAGGSVNLSLGVGEIDAQVRTNAHGAVDVSSDVGDAELFIDGHKVIAEPAPGSGHRLQMSGESHDALLVKVGVGDARLRIR